MTYLSGQSDHQSIFFSNLVSEAKCHPVVMKYLNSISEVTFLVVNEHNNDSDNYNDNFLDSDMNCCKKGKKENN